MLRSGATPAKRVGHSVHHVPRRLIGSAISSTRDHYYNEYWDRGKKSQWDGGEDITDKDRYREMYFDWAEDTNRSIHPVRFGNVGHGRKDYRNQGWGEQLEFNRIMRSICQGNYLNLTEEQMRAGYLGYMSEDDEFLTREEDEFGEKYAEASVMYRNEMLHDRCEGRPTYEWQVPAGADRYYGYKSVSTAVDINYTDAINENDVYDWEVMTDEKISMTAPHVVLVNRSTDAKLVLCTINDTLEAMDKMEDVDTCCLMLGADTILPAHDSILSSTCMVDTDLFQLLVGWSAYMHFFATFGCPVWLGTLTGLQLFKTWFTPSHILNKRILRKSREKELHVVLGDWLEPDWIEREHHVSDSDIAAVAQRYNMFGIGNGSAHGHFIVEGNMVKAQWYKFLIMLELHGITNTRRSKIKTVEDFEACEYPQSYAQAVQDKRLDVFAHTVNNMETNCAVVGVRHTTDISKELALKLVQKRLTGDIPVSVPLQYFEEHERVAVVWQ